MLLNAYHSLAKFFLIPTGNGSHSAPTVELQMIEPHLADIAKFVTAVARESDCSDKNIENCALLIWLVGLIFPLMAIKL